MAGESDVKEARKAWRFKAACLNEPTATFFPDTDKQAKKALTICNRCEVKESCLEFALETKEPYGVWGGATERERTRMLRVRGKSIEDKTEV